MPVDAFVENTWYPGQEVDDVVDALGHWIIKGGKSVFVEYQKP